MLYAIISQDRTGSLNNRLNARPDQRARLEKCLSIQAVSVEHHRQLYPEIIDEKSVNAARVQCRLQQTAGN